MILRRKNYMLWLQQNAHNGRIDSVSYAWSSYYSVLGTMPSLGGIDGVTTLLKINSKYDYKI